MATSPLNGMVVANHWDQWFFDGFGVREPLVTLVFNGCPPLVQRWNGLNLPSSKSKGQLNRGHDFLLVFDPILNFFEYID